MRVLLFLFVLFLSACAGAPDQGAPLVMKPVSYKALPGWQNEDFELISQALGRSCTRILKNGAGTSFGPDARFGVYGDWQKPCREFQRLDQKQMRGFFENNFTPYEARAGASREGLFTGYYEASLNGSYKKHGKYQVPLHKKPSDLVMVALGEFRDDLKGRRIAGRVKNGRLKPFESREDIVNGELRGDTLVWVDDEVDKFFLQIQGSGIVRLDNGSVMRVGYDGQNGHPYFAIGRELVHLGALRKDEVSLQSIRAWLKANPDKARGVMNANASYVFFRALKTGGPVGGEGVALTHARSLAVDRSKIPYGVPIWLSADHPDEAQGKLQQMVIAQDTGGAIRGAVRGDLFWGYGVRAEDLAGRMKSQGRYWFLLPKNIVATP